MARDIGDMAPIREALQEIERREKSAGELRDERARALFADVRGILTDAIADAVRPEHDEGLTVEEYAAREEISRWAVYKRVKRGEIPAKKLPNGDLLILTAA